MGKHPISQLPQNLGYMFWTLDISIFVLDLVGCLGLPLSFDAPSSASVAGVVL